MAKQANSKVLCQQLGEEEVQGFSEDVFLTGRHTGALNSLV